MFNRISSSKFKWVYCSLIFAFTVAGFGFNTAIEKVFLQHIKSQKVVSVESVIQSHSDSLILNDTRALRDELIRRKIIQDDKDFEIFNPAHHDEFEKIKRLSNGCGVFTANSCVSEKQYLFYKNPEFSDLSKNTFVIYFQTEYFDTSSLGYLYIFLADSLLLLLMIFIILSIRKYEKILHITMSKEIENSFKLFNLSRQVAHDIRSPLAALDSLVESFARLPESERIIARNAINRIRDIANNLLSNNSHCVDQKQKYPYLVRALVEAIISEKRQAYQSSNKVDLILRSCPIEIFSTNDPVALKRILSNLINNSFDAIKDIGKIVIEIIDSDDYFLIKVRDTGCGISPEILPQLMELGSTHNKVNGNGLGLYYASQTIKKMGGEISINSKVGEFTEATVRLPKAAKPDWFITELELDTIDEIYIVDDDRSVQMAWIEKFKYYPKLKLVSVRSLVELRKIVQHSAGSEVSRLFLFDYEFTNTQYSGLQFILDYKLENQSILVTSRFEEVQIIDCCVKNKIRLLPKSILPTLKIKRVESSPAVVLIDDDQCIRLTWDHIAKKKNFQFLSLSSCEEFIEKAKSIPKNAKVYIDYHLNRGMNGNVAAETLYKLGYENLHLTTGYLASEITVSPKFLSVTDKMPPWS